MKPVVDVAVLHRPSRPPCEQVLRAVRDQVGVQVRIRLHEGAPQPGDFNRWATIARSRNLARQYASSAWFMFVDDDVVLAEDCLALLLADLQADRRLAAVAADYDNDQFDPARAEHVSMGATLFRRSVLDGLVFRSTPHWCECWCACRDLRRRGHQIRYSAHARATHLKESSTANAKPFAAERMQQLPGAESLAGGNVGQPCILAAFDRRDVDRFEHQFLRTLRASGNRETVWAVAYGLYPSERARLQRLAGVQLRAFPFNGLLPPVRRLSDFASVIQHCHPATPVAYWDVADVVFQDSLGPLWHQVHEHPGRLLAVKEPKGYPDNQVIFAWSLSIRDPHHQRRAFELLRHHPFLNSGFAAGNAATMGRYFQEASRMRNAAELAGTTDWGDQMALNLYCHSDPNRWRAIDERWNYCVHDRRRGEVSVTPGGQVVSHSGAQISVAHGNARSLRQFALSTTFH